MRRLPYAVVLAISCLHCHSSKNGSNQEAGASVTPRITVRGDASTLRSLDANAAAAVNGGLSSLQYYISGISICQSVTLQGTGTTGSSGCVSLYEGPADSVLFPDGGAGGSPDYVAMATHARSVGTASATLHGDGYGYIDLLDPNSSGSLQSTSTFTAQDVGEYNYGLIYWAYPVKLTATLSAAGGNDMLYTHDGNIVAGNGTGTSTTTYASDLTVGPATQAVVTLPNGGTWFKFQNPLTITNDDVTNSSEFVVDLAFNPNGIITGYKNSVFGGPQLTDGPDDGNITGDFISVPMLDLTPVPHRSNETVQVETYVGTISTGTTDNLDVRIEFYSIAQDTNHTIYGVNTTPLVNAQTATAFAGFGKAAFIKTNTDGSIDLLDWNQTAFVSGLQRQSAVGGTTTVTISCTLSGASTPVFQGCVTPLSVTFKLVALTDISD